MVQHTSTDTCPSNVHPTLTQARAPLTCQTTVMNEFGQTVDLSIPAERPLTVYVDKRELVTLMTLGARPEWLVLGYLRNQRLVSSLADIESVTVDWDVGAASVKTRIGIDHFEAKTAKRVVTTGCGQGSMFGALMDDVADLVLPPNIRLRQSQLQAVVNAIRLQESTYKSAGSVHGCALFQGDELLLFVEDVGRHNAVDTIAGWMWLQQGLSGELMHGHDKVFYTTGRLTSEMVIKSAQMGVPVVVSRSGMTQMGLEVARQVGLCAIGRATHKRFLCFTHPERLVMDAVPEPAAASA
jgi:FdhD protein